MPVIDNTTAFAARDFLSIDKEGTDTLVICVCGSFRLPAPGRSGPEELPLADEQPEPIPEDVYWGDPGTSSLRYEGQSACFRPGTDIYVNGHAWAPLGHPAKEMLAALRVGAYRKGLQVFGDWKSLGGQKIHVERSPEFNGPPVGSCAAQKLISEARRLGLEIKSMTEFWVGPTNEEGRRDGHHYESCPTCKKLLPALLCPQQGNGTTTVELKTN